MNASHFIGRVNGMDYRTAARRRRFARQLLATVAKPPQDCMFDALESEVGGRAFYVVARDPRVRLKLAQTDRLQPVFDGAAATVFMLTKRG